MIKEAYDLDLTCYFPRDDDSAGETVRAIFESVEKSLQKKYKTESKGSAIRVLDCLNLTDSHIDVVPGRFVDGDEGDVFLFPTSGEKERLKTNLDTHISHVKDSGVVEAIRLMKLWKVRRGIAVKTFAIELLTIDALAGEASQRLPEQLRSVWTQLRDSIDTITITDPANPDGNDLSGLLPEATRKRLASESGDSLKIVDKDGWEAIFGPLTRSSHDDTAARRAEALRGIVARSPVPAKPWSRL